MLALDRLNQNAKKGLSTRPRPATATAPKPTVPLDSVPVLVMDLASLTQENFDSHEGFVLSRVNGQWDVRSILKLCPMAESHTLAIFARLLERKLIRLE